MTKSDLKTGMKVILKDGTKCIVMRGIRCELGSDEDCLVFMDKEGRTCINSYTDDMTVRLSSGGDLSRYNIEKVYISTNLNHTLQKTNYWKLIWEGIEEPEVEEISAQEAMKRLEEQSGKKVKIVSGQ